MQSNEFFLKKRCKILLNNDFAISLTNHCTKTEFATFLKNIAEIGFVFSPPVLTFLKSSSSYELKRLQNYLVPILNEMVGNHVNHKVFYPNFPKQVMEASDAELFLNAILHYVSFHLYDVSGGIFDTWLPNYEKEPRNQLDENVNYKIIKFGTVDEFASIFTELMGSNASISEFDKNVIRWFIEKNLVTKDMMPENIPQKEQLALFVATSVDYGKFNILSFLDNVVKTATDVLRIATGMSGGDVSLTEKTKFKKFSRKERRFILSMLDSVKNPLEDMYRYRYQWIRLGEILHPGEYQLRYKNTCDAFNTLRNVDKIKSFNGKVDNYLKNNDINSAMKLLISRPGELIKRLDFLLRNYSNIDVIKYCTKDVFSKVSTPVLLRFYGHMKHRNQEKDVRVFYPKGSMAKMFVKENDLVNLPTFAIRYFMALICDVLVDRFSEMESMGKVYIDENLENIKLPFSDRSASESLNIIPRASTFDVGDKNVLRFFIHWANTKDERIDLDLSAMFLDKEWNKKFHISYTNLRERGYKCCHSGDITDGGSPNKKTKNGKLPGVSEFIDVNFKSMKNSGIRYIIPSIYSFTFQPYSVIPYCFFGWMGRDKIQSGEIFEPGTVKNKINLTAEAQISVPMLIDVYENKIYWMDLSIQNGKIINNIESSAKNIVNISKGIMADEKPSVYNLLDFHIMARAERITDDPEEADIAFTMDNISEKLDSIKSDYMV